MVKRRSFPYLPKSVSTMERGDFWAIPLSNGAFSCGRVLQLGTEIQPRQMKMFWGAVMDWTSIEPPNRENIAGSRLLREGAMHILAIQSSGGTILGNRPLDLDSVAPSETVAAGIVYKGLNKIRPATSGDYDILQGHSTWGFGVASLIAEKWFVEKNPKVLDSKAINPFGIGVK